MQLTFHARHSCYNLLVTTKENHMGLMDFFKKGKEEPVKAKQPVTAPKPAAKPEAAKPYTASKREYVIKSGDSLSKIAKEFYGNAGDWKKILEANKDTIKNPDLIHPGQKIIIP
jgi:nucleoid-associated protein YgaU